MRKEFEVASGLPKVGRDFRLESVHFDSCPGSDLKIVCVASEDTSPCDEHGILGDSWWSIRCKGLPDRTLRLTKGTRSMINLLLRYAFLDGEHCLNTNHAHGCYVRAVDATLPLTPANVPSHLVRGTGVPQFFPQSGICWFNALCTVAFSTPDVRDFITSSLPHSIRSSAQRCLHDREASLALREFLWNEYKIGDDISLHPSKDGCNGCNEFMLVCAKLGIPIIVITEERGRMVERGTVNLRDKGGSPCSCRKPTSHRTRHLLVRRFVDGDHSKFPVERRIRHTCCGVSTRYRLAGVFCGQRKCGHQIGVASSTGHWRDMVIGDADMNKDGIGLVFVHFPGPGWMEESSWWGAWKHLIHVTKFGANGRELCNHNLHNEADCSLDSCKGRSTGVGSNSLDIVYISCNSA